MSSRRKASPRRKTSTIPTATEGLGAGDPAAAAAAEAGMTPELEFVKLVRVRFEARREVYEEFLAVMTQLRAGELDLTSVVRRTARMFRAGNRDLMLLFNQFLPAHSRVTEADLDNPSHPAFLLPANSYTAPRTKRLGESDGPVVKQVKRQKTEKKENKPVKPINPEEIKLQPVYSLVYPDAPLEQRAQGADLSKKNPAAVSVAGAAAATFAAAPGDADDPPTGELPRLLLPGDRVMVDMNDPSVHTESELQGAVPDYRQPELGRNRDPDLQQFLLDQVMAERFSRRGSARNQNHNQPTASSVAKLAATTPKWEACVVLSCSRDMLALNTTGGDKIYVLNSALATTSTKAFNDTSTIFSCQGCGSRMRVPRPCDVLVCFNCKTKVSPPPPSQRGAGTSFLTSGYGGSRLAQSHTSDRTDLPLRSIPPMNKGDFIGKLQVGEEVEIQVVYKCAHRVAARAWVMARVVGREKWNGSADLLQLMVPYPAPNANANARAGPGGYPPGRGGHFPGLDQQVGPFMPRRGGRGDVAGATAAAAAAATAGNLAAGGTDPTLELPAGIRFGSATVELPPLDALPDPGHMPDRVPIIVTTDATPLCERAAACQKIAKEQPHELAEMHIIVSDPPSPPGIPGSATASDRSTMTRVRSMRTAVILSFVPGLERHVVAYSEQEVKLLDLKTACFVVEPANERVYHASVLGKPGSHIKDCPVCFEPFDWSSLGRPSMSCHPRECCTKCLSSWAEGQIGEGKLYVRCPAEGCKKQLALNQVKQVVNRTKYNNFVASIREVHREAARAEEEEEHGKTEEEQKAFLEFVTQQDVRFCIGCFARIEKNKGCSHMTCWRCGTEFQWETAPPVSAGLPEAQAAAQKAAGERDARGAFGSARAIPLGPAPGMHPAARQRQPGGPAGPPPRHREGGGMAFNPLAYPESDDDDVSRWGTARPRRVHDVSSGASARDLGGTAAGGRNRVPSPEPLWVSQHSSGAARKQPAPASWPLLPAELPSIEEEQQHGMARSEVKSPEKQLRVEREKAAAGAAAAASTGYNPRPTRNRSGRSAGGSAAAAGGEDPFSPAAAAAAAPNVTMRSEPPKKKRLRSKSDQAGAAAPPAAPVEKVEEAAGKTPAAAALPALPPMKELKRKKKAELVAIAEERGVSSDGTKDDILARLEMMTRRAWRAGGVGAAS